MDVPCTLLFTILSRPTNAPPEMNRILVVSISTVVSPRRIPGGLILTLVPSINLSKACCTPSPDTSRLTVALSLLRAILSISSKKIIPRCVRSTSESAFWYNLNITESTSSPTYPASVRVVASAMANGTFKYCDTVFTNRVLPVPVGPTINIFALSISFSVLLIRL